MRTISIKIVPETKVFYLHDNKIEEGTVREVLLTKQRDVQKITINPKGTFDNKVQRVRMSADVWETKKELLNSL